MANPEHSELLAAADSGIIAARYVVSTGTPEDDRYRFAVVVGIADKADIERGLDRDVESGMLVVPVRRCIASAVSIPRGGDRRSSAEVEKEYVDGFRTLHASQLVLHGLTLDRHTIAASVAELVDPDQVELYGRSWIMSVLGMTAFSQAQRSFNLASGGRSPEADPINKQLRVGLTLGQVVADTLVGVSQVATQKLWEMPHDFLSPILNSVDASRAS